MRPGVFWVSWGVLGCPGVIRPTIGGIPEPTTAELTPVTVFMKGYETHYPNPNPCSKTTTRFFEVVVAVQTTIYSSLFEF